jgi:hypothetical protein
MDSQLLARYRTRRIRRRNARYAHTRRQSKRLTTCREPRVSRKIETHRRTVSLCQRTPGRGYNQCRIYTNLRDGCRLPNEAIKERPTRGESRHVRIEGGVNLTRSGSVASRPRIGYRQQPIHVSQVVAVAARWRQGGSGEVVARWWRRGGGEVVAFRRQNQVRQLKDTWPLGFLCL